MTVSRKRPHHGLAGTVQPRPARGYPTIRELHGRGTPRSSRVCGRKRSGTSTIRESLRGAPVDTSPRWGSTPPDYPVIREPARRRTSFVPRVRTARSPCASTIRESNGRPPRAESGTP